MNKPLKFDPSKVTYARRYVTKGKRRKDGTKNPNKTGPYWYANEMADGRFKTYYIGRELPPECIPYAEPETYLDHLVPGGNHAPKNIVRLRGASDSILEALDRGEQVVLDLNQIARDCNSYVDRIGDRRYVFYRDAVVKE